MSAIEGRAPSAIKKALDPLIGWYRQFKPDVNRVVIPQDDYDRLLECQKRTLDRNGFSVSSGRVTYQGFELVRR